jgi:hypothetical protein
MHLLARLALLSAWALSASAHFILQYPNSVGFSDDDEGTSPCGGFDVTFRSNDSSIPVGGFPVSLLSTHPAADFLFRATLDQKAPFNFTNLLPVISETGLGQFCLPALVAPADFAGKPGVIQVIQNGPDGILYQVSLEARSSSAPVVSDLSPRSVQRSTSFPASTTQLAPAAPT